MTGSMQPFGRVLMAAVSLLLATAAHGERPAPSGSVMLPHRDILPVTMPAEESSAAEGQREIRHPGPSGTSNAATPLPAGDQQPINRRSSSGGITRLSDFLPLLAVLVLIFAGVLAVKRFMPSRRLVSGAGVMEILARLPLTGKQSLVLVKLGQRLVLVGVSPERVNTVCIVDDPEQVALLIGRIAHQSRGSIGEAFGGSLDQEAEAFDDSEEASPFKTVGPIRGLLDKVRRMRRQEVA